MFFAIVTHNFKQRRWPRTTGLNAFFRVNVRFSPCSKSNKQNLTLECNYSNCMGHLREDCPITTIFWKHKIREFFWKRTNKIRGSTMQPLKTLKAFELTWPLRKQPSNSWMLLARLQRTWESLFSKNVWSWIIFQMPRFE